MGSHLDLTTVRYKELLADLTSTYLRGLTREEIADIKEEFGSQINSPRALSRVIDLEGLISILEARNLLNSSDVTALEKIAGKVNRPRASRRIEDFHQSLKPISPPVFVRPIKSSPKASNEIKSTTPPTSPKRNGENGLTDKVFDVVIDNLGYEWRKLARHLSFTNEQEINNIDRKCSSDEQKIREMLALYKEKRPNENHITSITKALEEIPRLKIVRKIQEIVPGY